VPAPNDDDDMLLQRADEALFRAKRAGRNCVQCQAPASEPAAAPAAAPPPEPALCEVAS
jgi:predicted signal transduction protein with EAL and GGDEF domain